MTDKRKWVLIYRDEACGEPLFFSTTEGRGTPVWSGDTKFVLDDGTVAYAGIDTIHFDKKSDADTLAFNMVMYDKRYMDHLYVEECSIEGCKECSPCAKTSGP